MTIKELYEWAVNKKWENFEISIPIADVVAYDNEVEVKYVQSIKEELRPELGNGEYIELHFANENHLEKKYIFSINVEEW